MNEARLYNILFPIWILYFFPPFIVIAIIGNLMIDASIIILVTKLNHIAIGQMKIYKYIFCSFLFGFLADFAGAFIVWLLSMKLNFISEFGFSDGKSFLVFMLIISTVGVAIYIFNYYYTRRILGMTRYCKKYATSMAIITAPWLFLFYI
jgi:hypothetical protein